MRDRSIAECRRHTSAWPTLAATTRRGFPWRSTAVGSAPGGRRCGGTDRMVSDQGPWHPTAWGGVGNYTLSPPLNFNGARWGDGGSSCILFGRVWGTTGGTHKAYLWQPDPGGGEACRPMARGSLHSSLASVPEPHSVIVQDHCQTPHFPLHRLFALPLPPRFPGRSVSHEIQAQTALKRPSFRLRSADRTRGGVWRARGGGGGSPTSKDSDRHLCTKWGDRKGAFFLQAKKN